LENIRIKSIKRLGKSFDKYDLQVSDNENFFANNMLVHNCRTICMIDENSDAKFYSRAGNEFKTLGKVAKVIKESGAKNVILDGEVCILDENGDEDFQSIIKEISKKNHTINNPRLIAFDILTPENFESGTSRNLLSKRYEALDFFMSTFITFFNEHVSMTKQEIVEDETQLEEHIAIAGKNGWEGLMLRKNDIYKGKRSSDILKVKSFVDAEYTVVSAQFSINRVIVNGKEVEEEMLKNIVIEHKGFQVDVGSGFSQEQRRKYFKNPELIVGKTVNVQYFQESRNLKGGYSLRFPVFKAVYDSKRTF
jgi:DNA ligase-1